MKIIIVGCGKVGIAVTEQLSLEKHDITIIDLRSDIVSEISNRYDVMGYVGNGASFETLNEAGIADADLLIAATDQDEINLLCCLFAKKAGNCNSIARVRNPQYRDEVTYIKEELGLSMVLNPDYDAAREIARVLRFPSADKIDTFANGKVELLKFEITEGSVLENKTLIDIAKLTKAEVLICAVERGEQVVIPNGIFKLEKNDTISIIASPQSCREFFKKIGVETHQVKDTIIAGGGRTAYYLAEQLINSGIAVKIIENNMERCEVLSEKLPKAIIIHGDATNQEVLSEEGLEQAEGFVSLTGMDEANMFLSLYAKKCSKAKVITKLNYFASNDIVKTFNLGSVVTPKNSSAELVVSYARARQNSIGSNIETLYKIIENKVEALEFKISVNSPVANVPIEQLKLKPNLLIGCIIRGRKMIIVNGKSVINAGDTVVVITTTSGFKDIKDILA